MCDSGINFFLHTSIEGLRVIDNDKNNDTMDDLIKSAEPVREKTNDEKARDGLSVHSDSDVEKQSLQAGQTVQLQRRLQSRHLQMIAIGGTIGTGLFIGSGGALATAGPAGALIAYIFVGTLVYSVMVALGEMVRNPRITSIKRLLISGHRQHTSPSREPSQSTPLASSTPVWDSPWVGSTGSPGPSPSR